MSFLSVSLFVFTTKLLANSTRQRLYSLSFKNLDVSIYRYAHLLYNF